MKILEELLKKKLIVITAIGATIFIIFYLGFCLPQQQRLNTTKKTLEQVEESIDRITKLMLGRDVGEAYVAFSEEVALYEASMPSKEEVVTMLTDTAIDLGIVVKDISAGPQHIFVQENPVVGYVCKEYEISMVMQSNFRAFGEYLDILRNKSPYFLRFNGFSVQAKTSMVSLDIKLGLLAYTLEESE